MIVLWFTSKQGENIIEQVSSFGTFCANFGVQLSEKRKWHVIIKFSTFSPWVTMVGPNSKGLGFVVSMYTHP